MMPQWPLYIPSKGRWQYERRLTVRALDEMNVPYRLVVEQQEYDEYAAVIDPARLLVLDPAYQRDYDTCDDLGDTKPKGSGPARNFIWDHAVSEGHAWHWIMDDNIKRFGRLHEGKRIKLIDGTAFRMMEDFCLRYENVAMAGPAYRGFARSPWGLPPFTTNTRIYSCNLIRCDVPFRWRGRFNEDTILSLDMLKAGWCTVQFYAFLQDKMTTQTIRGGNTDTIYVDGTLAKSQMLADVHGDVCRVAWKLNRWHHHCDYRQFKYTRLKKRADVEIPDGVNEYGMKLVKVGD